MDALSVTSASVIRENNFPLSVLARDRVLWALLAAQAVAAVPFLIPALLSESLHAAYSDSYADVIIGITACIAGILACRLQPRRGEERAFRRLLLATAGTWTIAEISMCLLPEAFADSLLGDAINDGIFALSLVWLLIAAELQPHRANGWTKHDGPFHMRIIGGLLCVAALYTYFNLAPSLSGLPDHDNWSRSLLLFIPLDVFLCLRFAWLHRFATTQRWRSIYLTLALLTLSMFVADVVEMMALEEWIPWIELEPMGLLWFAPYLGITVLARLVTVTHRKPVGAMPPEHTILTTEGVIVGLASVILVIHFVAPATAVLSPALQPIRTRIALTSIAVLGLLGIAQAILLARRNRALVSDIEGINAQLLHAQKMDAIGQLAGEVAHDFNNILAVVMGHEDALRRALNPADDARVHVDGIGEACHRANSLTKQLLAFSGKHIRTPMVVDLPVVVSRLASMLRRLIGTDIELDVRRFSQAAWIVADEGQIEQMIMNLAVNARDAMPAGGRLTIETEVENLDAAAASRVDSAPGAHVVMRVSDTGCGMSEEVRTRAFEPFFTTKPQATGTGLGLSTVYAIVERAAGHITIDSELGAGTTFRVVFRKSEQPPDVNTAPVTRENPPRGTETVLLVEDDPAVRSVVRRGLENHGYQVLEADGGPTALAIAKEHGTGIAILLTDVVMPGMSGPEVVERMASARPLMSVLYMSGYTGDELAERGVEGENTGFIQKPFSAAQLARRIRVLLDAPSAG